MTHSPVSSDEAPSRERPTERLDKYKPIPGMRMMPREILEQIEICRGGASSETNAELPAEAQRELEAFAAHLRDHPKHATVEGCRFCAQRNERGVYPPPSRG